MKKGQDRNFEEILNLRMESYGVNPGVRAMITNCVTFHTSPAPGVIIGAFMVDYALDLLHADPGDKLYGICETPKCLPDALQAIAHCTTGNNRLRVIPIGKFAITVNRASDNPTADAVRVYVDLVKLKKYRTIDAWYANNPSFEKASMKESLQEEILKAGRDILSHERVRVPVPKKLKWKSIACPCCGDPVPDYLLENDRCGSCGSMRYYEKVPV